MAPRIAPVHLAVVRPEAPGAQRGTLQVGTDQFACALGQSGIRSHKLEGDGGTPTGIWPVRKLLFRSDKIELQDLPYDLRSITPDDGWCDDPLDSLYNRPVQHPFRASAERLWRDDDLYDIIVVLGHNDQPPIPGRGSAIFLHVAKADLSPTRGCVALAKRDLITVLNLRPAIWGLRILEL